MQITGNPAEELQPPPNLPQGGGTDSAQGLLTQDGFLAHLCSERTSVRRNGRPMDMLLLVS
jgi:hypothetical protein